MNATVTRIVDIMFQDTEMSDEVVAIKDEVMNNCQERYDDLTARGMTEDDAIAAVVDSLKGMEEVISQYPRKAPGDEEFDAMDKEFEEMEEEFESLDHEGGDTDDRGETNLRFRGDDIHKIDITLLNEDVTIEPSEDDDIHVRYDQQDEPLSIGYDYVTAPRISVKARHGVLRVTRGEYRRGKQNARITINVDGHTIRMSSGGVEWDSVSDFVKNIKQTTFSALNHLRMGGSDVVIELPESGRYELVCHTTSGDMEIDNVPLSSVVMESTSGDLSIDMTEQAELGYLQVRGSSGDVEARLNAREMNLQTMSGDIGFEGECPDMTVSTVSGDMEIEGCVEKVKAKSVSGDINLIVANDGLKEISSRTTSGDLTIRLPEKLRGAVRVETKTTSGSVSNRWGQAGDDCRAVVNAQSVSGDIRIK